MFVSVVKGGSAANTLVKAMDSPWGRQLYAGTLIRNIGASCYKVGGGVLLLGVTTIQWRRQPAAAARSQQGSSKAAAGRGSSQAVKASNTMCSLPVLHACPALFTCTPSLLTHPPGHAAAASRLIGSRPTPGAMPPPLFQNDTCTSTPSSLSPCRTVMRLLVV